MAENKATAIVVREDDKAVDSNNQPQPNPISSLFSNFLKLFNLPPPKKVETVKAETTVVPTTVEAEEVAESKADTVKYPITQPVVEPLKLEAEELEQNTNPVVLWQVYAIGGFFVLRWALARWKERKARRPPPPSEPSSEDPPANQ